MKIATVGSCQAMALNWYIRQLRPDDEVKWCCSELWRSWENTDFNDPNSHWGSQAHDNIWSVDECVEYLKSADYIVYQKLQPETSDMFNYQKIESYKKQDTQTTTFSFIQNGTPEEFEGMKERELKLNLDIPVSDMLIDPIFKNKFKFAAGGNHCNSVLFLEILRKVAEIFNWNFFDQHSYDDIARKQYPFNIT